METTQGASSREYRENIHFLLFIVISEYPDSPICSINFE